MHSPPIGTNEHHSFLVTSCLGMCSKCSPGANNQDIEFWHNAYKLTVGSKLGALQNVLIFPII